MFKNPFAGFDFGSPFERKRSRNLFGVHTTPREFKHGARDIPFGMGAKSLYVDGTNGHDSNDGESWITAKATIQEAVDTADSWMQIFVKAGTYAESVSITDDSITLIGESRDTVEIKPSTGTALTITNPNFKAFSLSTISNDSYSTVINGSYCTLSEIATIATSAANGIYVNASNCDLNAIYSSDALTSDSVVFAAGILHSTIKNSYLNPTRFGADAIVLLSNADNIIIRDNIIEGASNGITAFSGAANNTIFHNNFISCTTPITGVDCDFFENFYDDHTNVDNGYGIATEPYISNITTIDQRPVIVRNGWNSVSILRSLLRKKTAAQTTQAATNANGTAWVDLKTIAPTTSDIELYQVKMTTAGSWAGTAKYRIIVGSTKVYPFPADKSITSGTLESFIFPINIQINETAKLQFRSDNAADGAGDTVTLNQLDYATVL